MSLIVNRTPSPQQCCEVCRAARTLQRAVDALNTFTALGGAPLPTDRRTQAVQEATAVWEYSRAGRHTGIAHAPVVPLA